jgi:GntR family transcriptional regulator
MRVVLSNNAGVPLYQQVKEQVGTAILSGELPEGSALPSVRALARDLRISIITTTRAYAELAAEGFIATVPGKGAYVLPLDSALVREQLLRQVEDGLQAALDAARRAGLQRAELIEILDGLMNAEQDAVRQRDHDAGRTGSEVRTGGPDR